MSKLNICTGSEHAKILKKKTAKGNKLENSPLQDEISGPWQMHF
jgi:hypothetical protein